MPARYPDTYEGCRHCGCDQWTEQRYGEFVCAECGEPWETVDWCAYCGAPAYECQCEVCDYCGMVDCTCAETERYLLAVQGMVQRALDHIGNVRTMREALAVARRAIEEAQELVEDMERPEIRVRLPRGEVFCPTCLGTGAVERPGGWQVCLTCNGTGHIPYVPSTRGGRRGEAETRQDVAVARSA
jgi:hypothetical protein